MHTIKMYIADSYQGLVFALRHHEVGVTEMDEYSGI